MFEMELVWLMRIKKIKKTGLESEHMQGSNQHISSMLPHDNHTCYDESEVFVVIKKTR